MTEIVHIGALLFALVALVAYVNHKFVKLPHTVGIVVLGLALSFGALGLDNIYPDAQVASALGGIMAKIDFNALLMDGMIGFLLFAGALHVNLNGLLEKRWVILTLASLGVLVSTGLVGLLAWGAWGALGLSVPLVWCLVFGSLISRSTEPLQT